MQIEELAKIHLEKIRSISKHIDRDITLMEICGGHTNTIMKYGIREILPDNIKLISGPGCPVCVSSQKDIDNMIELARSGVPIATYGDMMRVPGSKNSLDDIKAEGHKIFEIYSATEVLRLQDTYPDIVFFGIGFETTAPMTAFLLKNGITVYSVHKLVPPALILLSKGDINIDGFINPGHVSTIIGIQDYKKIKIPQAVAGFEPEQILRAIKFLMRLIRENKTETINAYPEAVRDEGNKNAKALLNEYFKIEDSEWRGLGIIPASSLEVKEDALNAKIKYKDLLDNVPTPKDTGCRCGEILKGLIEPIECPLYKESCTPESPKGACMVSEEGSCAIYYRYGKE